MQTIYCKLNIETESEIMVHDARVALLTGVVETPSDIEEPTGVIARAICVNGENYNLFDASTENAYIMAPDALLDLRRHVGYTPSSEPAMERKQARPSL